MAPSMTIEELAREAGMTVRNIRAHQTRGLLPPPELRGRTGYYGPDHLSRLGVIKDMQAAGFNLGAIKAILDSAPSGTAHELLRFERALLESWNPEPPRQFAVQELSTMFANPTAKVISRARKLGVIEEGDDGALMSRMPSLLSAGKQILELGVSPDETLDVLENLLHHARGIADAFVRLFIEGVWRPFEKAGKPAEDWPKVRQALEELRPLAHEALGSAFGSVMTDAVDEAFGREIEEMLRSDEAAGI